MMEPLINHSSIDKLLAGVYTKYKTPKGGVKVRKWRVTIWSIVAVLVLVITASIPGCQNPDTGAGKPGSSTPVVDVGTGKIAGVVTDSEVSLPEGAAAQTYQGASITILKAVATGGYSQLCGDCPKIPSYDVGEIAVELKSGKDGRWEVELPAGKYFIRAFLGERTYSGDIFVEVIKGETVKLDIKLISGV